MNKLKYWQQKNGTVVHYWIWLICAIASVTVPVYILITWSKSNAASHEQAPPKAALVINAGGEVFIKLGRTRSKRVNQDGRTPEGEQAKLQKWGDELTVEGNGESQARLNSIPPGNQAYASPQFTLTTYTFPCRGKVGGLIVGWQKNKRRGCAPPGFEVRLSSGNQSFQLPNNNTVQASKNLLQAQTSLNQLRYCTVAASGQGWWFRWGTYEEPCEDATQQCLRSISNGECIVVSLGEWSVREQDLFVSVECADNRVFTDRGNGLEVAKDLVIKVTEEALNAGAKSCALNVYQPDKVIVSPASEIATLIQAQELNGTLTIDALAGDVIIRSAKKPEGILIKVGNRYIYPEDNIQAINLAEVVNSPAVVAFLDAANWPRDATSQIEDYKAALGKSADPSPRTNQTGEVLRILWDVWNIFRPTQRPEPTETTPTPTRTIPTQTTPIPAQSIPK